MTSAYSVFANHGYKTTAYGITRITTLTGDPIFDFDADAARERVLSEKTVEYMNHMMRLVDEHTGIVSRQFKRILRQTRSMGSIARQNKL